MRMSMIIKYFYAIEYIVSQVMYYNKLVCISFTKYAQLSFLYKTNLENDGTLFYPFVVCNCIK